MTEIVVTFHISSCGFDGKEFSVRIEASGDGRGPYIMDGCGDTFGEAVEHAANQARKFIFNTRTEP